MWERCRTELPDGKVYYGVRQTRFGVKTATQTRFGDLKTQLEFELFGTGGDAGQTTFRLRHAYGELGQFGAGQTWSAFMDIDVFPNTIELLGTEWDGLLPQRPVSLDADSQGRPSAYIGSRTPWGNGRPGYLCRSH